MEDYVNQNENQISEKKSEKKVKKSKNIFGFFKNFRIDLEQSILAFQENGKLMFATVFFSLVLMFAVALIVFFRVVQGQERVMVPKVEGKPLSEALLEMQVKELYPRIQLRFSEKVGDAGKILEQNPESGAIVKAGRRIDLVVSRGVFIDQLDDYKGLSLNDVQSELQTLYTGSVTPLISLAEPIYCTNEAAPGTILEQSPQGGTPISEPVTVNLIVSRGSQVETVEIPNVVGKDITSMMDTMTSSKVIFDFTSHVALPGEIVGTVTSEQEFNTQFIPSYSRISVDFAFPEKVESTTENTTSSSEKVDVYGIFQDEITNYPYPVPMKFEAFTANGDNLISIKFFHIGGNFTIPYSVPEGSTLILSVLDREHKRITVK